jgi:hypothetical protein
MRAMKRVLVIAIAAAVLAVLPLLGAGGHAALAAPPPKGSCKGCHADFASVLPKGHPAVKGTGRPPAAPATRRTWRARTAKRLLRRMHRAHIPPKGKLECTACHSWVRARASG